MSVASDKDKPSPPPPFDINEGATGVRLPGIPEIMGTTAINAAQDVEGIARYFEQLLGGNAPTDNPVVRAAALMGVDPPRYATPDGVAKAVGSPPTAFTFGRMSYMPDNAINGGVIQWPGFAPDSLRKIVRENIAPQLIIGMRVDDVIRYSDLSTQIWRPGWCIEVRDNQLNPTSAELKEIKDAQRFLANSNIETTYAQARQRDGKHLTGFQKFLAQIVRDTLTFDAIGVWTDTDNQGKVKTFAALPAGNLRLTTANGYNNDPKVFAVALDDGGRVIQAFNRDELIFYVRNPRTDPAIFGYGYSEVEIAVRLIAGFQGAVDLNIDMFLKNSTPNGIVTISGGTVTQRQLDLLTRLFANMKRGITKAWALPVMGLADNAKLEVHDLSRVKGNEAYYKEWMNMLAGAFCTIYRFPVKRLGYRISGTHKDTEPAPDPAPAKMDEADPGLPPLLTHLEIIINEYLIWTRWPHLVFRFNGKSPAEDGRAYEARSLARTWKEKRAEAGLRPLTDIVESGQKKLAEIMEMCPSDPNMSGAFSTLAAAMFKAESDVKDAKVQGNAMTSKIDPARSSAHGHEPGVRRDSAAESK